MTNGSSVPPNSTPEIADGDASASTLKAGDRASDPSSQSRAPVRRSSLRPAPADYRPSARDPSTLRPMAVVRAGDAETDSLRDDIAVPPPSQPSQASSVSGAHVEPFALAEDYSVNESGDNTTPLMIPPPSAVPIDLIQKVHGNRQSLQVSTTLANPLEPQRQTRHHQAAAEVTTGSGRDRAPSSASATARSISQPALSDSTRTNEPYTSNRRKYSLVAVALASMVFVGAVLAIMRVGHHNVADPTAQSRARVDPALQHPDAPKLIDAPPVAREPNGPAAQQAAASQSAVPLPAASAPHDMTRVTLDLAPIDAKVNYLGRDVPGPPFEFEVAKGQRIAVEVTRFGFATAKVVIDDKKGLVHFGMLRDHRAKPR